MEVSSSEQSRLQGNALVRRDTTSDAIVVRKDDKLCPIDQSLRNGFFKNCLDIDKYLNKVFPKGDGIRVFGPQENEIMSYYQSVSNLAVHLTPQWIGDWRSFAFRHRTMLATGFLFVTYCSPQNSIRRQRREFTTRFFSFSAMCLLLLQMMGGFPNLFTTHFISFALGMDRCSILKRQRLYAQRVCKGEIAFRFLVARILNCRYLDVDWEWTYFKPGDVADGVLWDGHPDKKKIACLAHATTNVWNSRNFWLERLSEERSFFLLWLREKFSSYTKGSSRRSNIEIHSKGLSEKELEKYMDQVFGQVERQINDLAEKLLKKIDALFRERVVYLAPKKRVLFRYNRLETFFLSDLRNLSDSVRDVKASLKDLQEEEDLD